MKIVTKKELEYKFLEEIINFINFLHKNNFKKCCTETVMFENSNKSKYMFLQNFAMEIKKEKKIFLTVSFTKMSDTINLKRHIFERHFSYSGHISEEPLPFKIGPFEEYNVKNFYEKNILKGEKFEEFFEIAKQIEKIYLMYCLEKKKEEIIIF